MADLKSMFEDLNFTGIKTYIQSGNVIFDSNGESNDLDLASIIERAINNKFGFDVPVIVRTPEELKEAIDKNPFYRSGEDILRLHLTFLNEIPSPESKAKAGSCNFEPDQFVIDGRDVFVYCVGKYHESKLTNNFFESKLKVRATTRNWKTVCKLLELSS